MSAAPGKCFLVTGPPGVGKTTLVMRVLECLRASNPHLKARGFYSREVREGSQRIGFEIVTLDGRRGRLASSKVSSVESMRWPSVGKYKVDLASFESLALPELVVKEDTELYIIDEVGKMELYSPSFFPAVLRVLESGIPVLASIPIPKYGNDFPGVSRVRNHPGAVLFTLNTGNRDAIKDEKMSTPDKGRTGGGRSYISWNAEADAYFLDILAEVLNEGNKKTHDGKIKGSTWDEVIEKYNTRRNTGITRKNVESRLKTWRLMYRNYSKIANQSGWGWNFIQGYTDIDDEIWKEFVKAHPECESYKGKPCLIFEQLQQIFEGSMATRNMAKQGDEVEFVPNTQDVEMNTFNTTQETMDMDSDLPPSSGGSSRVAIEKKKRRARPYAVSHQIIADSFKGASKAIMHMCEIDQQNQATRNEQFKELVDTQKKLVEVQERLVDIKEKTKNYLDHAVVALLQIEGLSTEEQYEARELFQKPEFCKMFLSLSAEMRYGWLRFRK